MAATSGPQQKKTQSSSEHVRMQSLLQPSLKKKQLLRADYAFSWIRKCCMKLDVSFEATYRATWICSQLQSSGFQSGHVLQAIAAVIFLACKCSDQMRQPRDVLNCLHAVHQGDDKYLPLGSAYRTLKHGLIAREALILRFLHFDAGLNLNLPHTHALHMLQLLEITNQPAQAVLSVLNDLTPCIVEQPPAQVGCAACLVLLSATHLAGSTSKQALDTASAGGEASSAPKQLSVSQQDLWDAALGSGASSVGLQDALGLVTRCLLDIWEVKRPTTPYTQAVHAALLQMVEFVPSLKAPDS